ncbi:MAG: response regulator transcription factor, partial [Ideonella sp.]|nr:response regulator transcription factor [Ideonella sp.]
MTAPIRLVIADDHELVRAGMRLLLGASPEIEVVGEARGGVELGDAVDRLRPDVVITDLSMPDGDGVAAIEWLRQRHPAIRILVLSMYDTPETIRRAMRAGADGYVLKGSPSAEIEQAVRDVMRGSTYFSPRAAQRLAADDAPQPEDLLTPRQIEILGLLARGLSSKEIGYDLGLSSKTVDVHRASIMARLGLGDVASLTLYAVRAGLVDPLTDGR